jgi:hypothetical protein
MREEWSLVASLSIGRNICFQGMVEELGRKMEAFILPCFFHFLALVLCGYWTIDCVKFWFGVRDWRLGARIA